MANDWQETLQWYRDNKTTAEIGFDPAGMCLKIARTAHGIGSMYESAKVAQDATPDEFRVYQVRDLRRAMVLYFDDPNDSNRFGHVVGMVGRVKDADFDDLNDVLVSTGSVVAGELVIVRATYFKEHWGDSFQFGATWLNGVELDIPSKLTRVEKFRRQHKTGYNVHLLDNAIRLDKRRDLVDDVKQIDVLVNQLGENRDRHRIQAFKALYNEDRILRISLLRDVINDFPDDTDTKKVFVALTRLIKSLPAK